MIVCHCRVATDKDISSAIDSGAHTVEQIGRMCGAGTGCGACHGYLADRLDEARASCPGQGNCLDCSRAREAA